MLASRLEGQLSGVAFTTNGSPVLYQGVPTALNFTLNTYSPAFIQGGTLISPQQTGTAPLVFLPSTSVTLSTESSAVYTAEAGLLSVGDFDAKLTGDFIGLPADLQFRPVSSNGNLPSTLGRRIKFEFKGENVIPSAGTDLDPSDGKIAYNGPTTDFKVESVGTPGTREFKVEGKLGVLDSTIAINAPFEIKQQGSLSSTGITKYEIKGEGPGYVSFGTNSSVSFVGSARRQTEFKFEQGNNKLEGKTAGDIAFSVSPGGTFTSYTPVVGSNNNGSTFTPSTPLPSGGSNTVVNVTSSTYTAAANFTFINTNVSTSTVRLFQPTSLVTGQYGDDDDDGDDDDNDVIFGNLTYTVYAKRAVQVVVESDNNGRIYVVEREQGRGRALGRKRRVISTYQVVGLPSRVFPGLVGLKQIANAPETNDDTTTTPNPTPGDDDDDDNTTITPGDDDNGDDDGDDDDDDNTTITPGDDDNGDDDGDDDDDDNTSITPGDDDNGDDDGDDDGDD